jgi:hypothetical protein
MAILGSDLGPALCLFCKHSRLAKQREYARRRREERPEAVRLGWAKHYRKYQQKYSYRSQERRRKNPQYFYQYNGKYYLMNKNKLIVRRRERKSEQIIADIARIIARP